ncbi:hypothetical protein [Herpetosiphon giganteus]|uniref:hypothetical protein n=1 Tax=Herpetosiphon giganteus TaxID=2029754 RepID=UPI001957CFC6|nr:hypothetical protein [Herpetosiphon giganteus]MBM7842836.1 hypothetical protein [Herpetosiphon giganteus]
MSRKAVIKNYIQRYKCGEKEARERFNSIQKLCTNVRPTYRAIWQAMQDNKNTTDLLIAESAKNIHLSENKGISIENINRIKRNENSIDKLSRIRARWGINTSSPNNAKLVEQNDRIIVKKKIIPKKVLIYEKLAEVSVLKKKYGYSANKGILPRKRLESLQRAVVGEGIKKVTAHIELLYKMRKNHPNMENAIVIWEADLEYLKKVKYNKKKNSYSWPIIN